MNCKKITLFSLVVATTLFFSLSNAIAQDKDNGENNIKNVRFGLKVTPMVSWFRTDGLKTIESNGSKLKFGYGLVLEFRLNKNISFATGVGGDYQGGKLNFKDSAVYYALDDAPLAIKNYNDTVGQGSKTAQYLLKSRDYSVNYINVPITLKMKTNDINGITYYGLFGGDLGIRTKAKATDDFTALKVPAGTTYNGKDINITKDVNLLNICLNVGLGMEYNLAGNTSLLLGLNYRRGFISAVKGDSDFITKGKSTTAALKQSSFSDNVLLTVGVLF